MTTHTPDRRLLPNVVALIVAIAQSASAVAAQPTEAEVVAVRRIWNGAPHNAFTDLVRWRDRWICAFREGASHADSRGAIRVLASTDAVDWQSLAKIEDEVLDLRDANLNVAPDGRLMILGGAQSLEDGGRSTRSFVTFSDDGRTWTPREFVTPPGRWLWSVTWHNGVAWGVDYPTPARPGVTSLLSSRDGRTFEPLVDEFFMKSAVPTEARIRFAADGAALCLHRCDGADNFAWLGRAAAPDKEWTWQKLDRHIGGPNLLQLPGGQWIAAGRIHTPEPKTAILQLDVDDNSDGAELTPLVTLPSAGDASYPGLVWHDDRLWVSYYSSHEEGTNIYLAEVRIGDSE